MEWNPRVYEQFAAEREAPFEDLMQWITVSPRRSIVDLGCGTGALTRKLADRMPESEVLGVDLSHEMLARAKTHERPGLRFFHGDLSTLEGAWDLVFSHAAIHWVLGHEQLIPRLVSRVKPGGQLAVQLPSNHTHASHRLLAETAQEEPFSAYPLREASVRDVQSIESYATLLYRSGMVDLHVMEKVYPHVMPDADAVVQWTRGTALLPYLERLPVELHDRFVQRYTERMRETLSDKPLFYPFKRTLFVARKPLMDADLVT